VVSLEELVDVKGWKALGNRLSSYKVTKIRPLDEPDEGSPEDDDEEREPTSQATGTGEGAESPKKKSAYEETHIEEDGQTALFSKDTGSLIGRQPPRPKGKGRKEPKQGSLFRESQEKTEKKIDDSPAFGVGDTVNLDL